jgi:hypothetical protein
MEADLDDRAIVRLYIERGTHRYHALLPRPVVAFFSEFDETYPRGKDKGILDALRSPGAPPQPPRPPPAAEPARLREEWEFMLGSMSDSREVGRAFAISPCRSGTFPTPSLAPVNLSAAPVPLRRHDARVNFLRIAVALNTRPTADRHTLFNGPASASRISGE